MTRGEEFVANVKEIAALLKALPAGAEAILDWPKAPPDLILAVALLGGSQIRLSALEGGDELVWVEWVCDGVRVRARAGGNGRPRLALLKP